MIIIKIMLPINLAELLEKNRIEDKKNKSYVENIP